MLSDILGDREAFKGSSKEMINGVIVLKWSVIVLVPAFILYFSLFRQVN